MDRFPTLALCLLLLGAPSGSFAEPDDAQPPAPPEASTEAAPQSTVDERVTVVSTRLPGATEPAERSPALVTVLDVEAIERAGVRTLQDLLAFEAGVSVYDQIGNDLQKTLDLRGFGGGSGTRVWLDGAPLNDSKNNSLALELVPLGAIGRVELARGPSSWVGGAGALGGIVRLSSRHAEPGLGGRLSLATGSFDTREAGGELHGTFDRLDFTVAGSAEETDGFRDNSGGDLDRVLGRVGFNLGAERRLELSLLHGRGDLGSPGALTAEEWAANEEHAPFNQLDRIDQRTTQAALNFSGAAGARVMLAANLFARERDAESLTTGRSAPSFGGAFLDAEESAVGATLQAMHRASGSGWENSLTAGAEWLDGDTDSVGIRTPAGNLGLVDPANTASDNDTERRTTALFVQDTWRPTARLTLVGSVRADRDEVQYDETFPDSGNDAERSFSEISSRASAMFGFSEQGSVWATFAEAFLPPTVEDLYAFPTFGSNPGLEPEDTRSFEVGVRQAWSAGTSLDVTAFVADTEDEIVFDPGSPLGLFGASVNAGETRRQGIDAALHATFSSTVRGFANLSLIDAEFRNGPDAGNEIPLVPGERVAVGLDADLAPRLRLRADLLWVGEQVLDSDAANDQPKLDAYAVANTRIAWRALEGASWGRLELWAEVRNLLDERYATRGIWAFDFSTLQNDAFFTPAPGRRWLAGVEWEF